MSGCFCLPLYELKDPVFQKLQTAVSIVIINCICDIFDVMCLATVTLEFHIKEDI